MSMRQTTEVNEFAGTLKYLNKVEVAKASDVIVDQIVKLLNDGLLKPGDRLPPERVMAQQFGVGRSQVRDAITRLVSLGILKTMPQSGTYVSETTIDELSSGLRDVLAQRQRNDDEVLKLWLLVTAAEFAQGGYDKHLARLREFVARLEGKASRGEFSISDGREVSAHVRGLYQGELIRRILDSLDPIVNGILAEHVQLSLEKQIELCRHLKSVVQELESGNPGKAACCMRRYNGVLARLMKKAG